MIYDIIKRLEQLGREVHGLSRGRDGRKYIICSARHDWDHHDKQARTFTAVNYKEENYGWIYFTFSMSRTAMASSSVRKYTGDPEKFLKEAGLYRFKNILLEDDTPGKKEEVLIHSRSEPSEYVLYDSEYLANEVNRSKISLLKKLWEDKYRGIIWTNREEVQDAICTIFSISNPLIKSLGERGLIKINPENNFLSITSKGEEEYEKIKDVSINKTTTQIKITDMQNNDYDIFISHASEDKEEFVSDLAIRLQSLGLAVWYDDFELKVGMSLRRSIDRGLSSSQYGIVVLSHNFFRKEWPQKELDALFSRLSDTEGRILPIWHNLNAQDVKEYSPLLSDIYAINSNEGVDIIAEKIYEVIKDRKRS